MVIAGLHTMSQANTCGDSWLTGGRYRIRTYDFHRVKNEVNHLNPSSSLVFPHQHTPKNPRKSPSFGDELVTSRSWLSGGSPASLAGSDENLLADPDPWLHAPERIATGTLLPANRLVVSWDRVARIPRGRECRVHHLEVLISSLTRHDVTRITDVEWPQAEYLAVRILFLRSAVSLDGLSPRSPQRVDHPV